MLFRARYKPGLSQQLRQFLWPRRGWTRAFSYLAHRIARLPGTPYSIAAGFACGAAISFTPFVGFHFALAALIAWLIGGNIIASAIGTVIGNPWTFPLIWWWVFRLGAFVLGLGPSHEVSEDFTMRYIFDNPQRVFLPMLVGSLPTAVVAWAACYFPTRYLIEGYRRARKRRRGRRLSAAAEAVKRQESSK